MERTTKGIFDFLCQQMEKLDKKQISVEALKAQGNSAKQLNNLLKYELDRARFVAKNPNAVIKQIEQ